MLARGIHGCIYHPPLPCKDSTLNELYGNEGYVMKCGQMGSELKIAERLAIIDSTQTYFIYPYPTPCELKEPAADCAYQCDVGYIMKYGGPTFYNRINSNPPSLVDLYSWFVKLVTALSLLQNNKILHGDIKPDNILIDSKGEPHLIDFSLSSQYNLPEHTHIASSFDVYLPLFATIHHLESVKESIPNMEKVIEEIKQYPSENYTSLPDFRTALRDVIYEYIINSDDYGSYIYNRITKVDLWSLANTFYFWGFLPYREHYVTTDPKFSAKFERILLGMLNLNPKAEYTLEQVFEEMKSPT